MDEILGTVSMLAQDQYGNYVVQVLNFSDYFSLFLLLVTTIVEICVDDSHILFTFNNYLFIKICCFILYHPVNMSSEVGSSHMTWVLGFYSDQYDDHLWNTTVFAITFFDIQYSIPFKYAS